MKVIGMRIGRISTLAAALLFVGTTTYAQDFGSQKDTTAMPAHMAQAETLLSELPNATLNVYGGRRSKDYIDWNAAHPAARTVCSTFASLLLEHTYGFSSGEIRAWIGSGSPDAAQVHDTIAAEKGFLRIRHIAKIQPGDFIAIRYHDSSKDTGHVMMAEQAPIPMDPVEPIIPGTTQYKLPIIDSTSKGHGPTDTRHVGGRYLGGIGRGDFRLYADASGKIVGYAWSPTPEAKFCTDPARDLVVGRLTRISR